MKLWKLRMLWRWRRLKLFWMMREYIWGFVWGGAEAFVLYADGFEDYVGDPRWHTFCRRKDGVQLHDVNQKG